MNRFIWATALAMAPAAAFAVDFQSAATLGVSSGKISNGGGDLKTFTVDVDSVADFGNGFVLGFDLGLSRSEGSVPGNDFDTTTFQLDGYYTLENGVGFGAYAEQTKFVLPGLLNSTYRSMGVSGGYSNEVVQAKAFFGKTTTDPALPAGTKVLDYGVSFVFSATDKLSLATNLIRTQVKNGGATADVDLFDIGAVYQVNDRWSVNGAFSTLDLATLNADVRTYAVGASYVVGSSSVPVTLSLELARSELSVGGVTGKLDSVRFGATIPLGGGAAKAPLNSVSSNVFRSSHSAIASGILAAY